MKKNRHQIIQEVMAIIGNDDSLKIMADKTGIKLTTLHRIKSDKTACSIDNLEKLMTGYGITWERILWRITQPKKGGV